MTEPAATHPKRIQLRRTKGWRMPPNTVKVDRSTKWGNIFVAGRPNPLIPGAVVADRRHAYLLFRAHAPLNDDLVEAARRELRGLNLGCWCSPDEDCHADVYLDLANG